MSKYSGGQGHVTQLGCWSFGEPPGQPLKVVTTSTSSFSAKRTHLRKAVSWAVAIFLSGWIGLPWTDRHEILSPRLVMEFSHSLAFLSLASRASVSQCAVPG